MVKLSNEKGLIMTEHKVIFGDSRSLNKIKDKSVQLIVTSPPYWQFKRLW